MAGTAEQAIVVEPALAAAVGDGDDVVAFTTLNPHSRQVPLSRFFTSRRTYQGLLRSFHSWTQASPQNVRRGGATGPRHHRQIGAPVWSRSGFPHSSAVTTR